MASPEEGVEADVAVERGSADEGGVSWAPVALEDPLGGGRQFVYYLLGERKGGREGGRGRNEERKTNCVYYLHLHEYNVLIGTQNPDVGCKKQCHTPLAACNDTFIVTTCILTNR